MTTALSVTVLDTQSNQSFGVSFDRFPVRIGRNQLNDLHVDRPFISQFHAAVEVRDGRLLIKDLGSTNGTVFQGQKLLRDHLVDITLTPEIQVGPIAVRFELAEIGARPTLVPQEASVLEIGTELGMAVAQRRLQPVAPGQEDPFVRQVAPYIEAYRSAWGNVYRLVYVHLPRLAPEVRVSYLKRLLIEHPAVAQEDDFQKVSRYYGVMAHEWGEINYAKAAVAALLELARVLAPGTQPPADVEPLLGFARRLRDAVEEFLKCFVSLRDGYQEFESEVLRLERVVQGNRVANAKDGKELGAVLLGEGGGPEVRRHLHDVFVDVMTHQVALLNGVMEGVKQLLAKLSPQALEAEYERRGKKGGLFASKYEGMWRLYETVHGDYSGEDKETFLIIFGPQFSRAYAATSGEAYQSSSSGEPAGAGIGRFAAPVNQPRR
ncbi:MAG: FHA domain-containing protein [Deltaproteobacteria bacterium]|nr:FHA domain-containing protein [Deltaproteobacteria bacterium]